MSSATVIKLGFIFQCHFFKRCGIKTPSAKRILGLAGTRIMILSKLIMVYVCVCLCERLWTWVDMGPVANDEQWVQRPLY